MTADLQLRYRWPAVLILGAMGVVPCYASGALREAFERAAATGRWASGCEKHVDAFTDEEWTNCVAAVGKLDQGSLLIVTRSDFEGFGLNISTGSARPTAQSVLVRIDKNSPIVLEPDELVIAVESDSVQILFQESNPLAADLVEQMKAGNVIRFRVQTDGQTDFSHSLAGFTAAIELLHGQGVPVSDDGDTR